MMMKTKLLSSSLPRWSFIHTSGAVGCAGRGRWCFSYALVIVLGWLCLVRGVVVIVRRSHGHLLGGCHPSQVDGVISSIGFV